MRVLVTGSSGHLGEALMRLLPLAGHDAVGLDLVPSRHTAHAGSIADAALVARAMAGAEAVIHAATLHKPHVATHSRHAFVETNVTGTLTLLEVAARQGVSRFILTSTTSAFGSALTPSPGAPAAWIDEDVVPVPKNVYGVTKCSAEALCALFARQGMNVVVLRTARFFPEPDDNAAVRGGYADANAKANEFLFRRIDLEDAASAHLRALEVAPDLGHAMFVVSATTPFTPDDLTALATDPKSVVAARYPKFERVYGSLGFRMFPAIDRVYDNARARRDLGWTPRHDFGTVLGQIGSGQGIGSDLARAVGIKGYHGGAFRDGLYPVEAR